MKKLAIVGASAALAAMPVVGVFAATENNVTDVITVTIDNACTITATAGTGGSISGETNYTVSYSDTIANGGQAEFGNTSMKVTCNDVGGWYINAIGAGTGSVVTSMDATGAGTDIVTGTTFDGTVSNWAMRVFTEDTGAYAPTIDNSFDAATYVAVPASATKVAHGATTDQTTGSTVKTAYKVGISPTQQADTYTGKVQYTLIHPSGE